MSGDRIRRSWTHRRLGLGAMKPTDAQLAQTDVLLASIGARDVGSALSALGAFEAALFDFACDVDLTAGVGNVDACPVPAELLRLSRPAVKPQRVTWRVMIPAFSGGAAALGVALTLLLTRGATPDISPAATAVAESHQLLRHAHSLIVDAETAAPAERSRLVSEARADLNHVSRLLPLTTTDERPAIRHQLFALRHQVPVIVVPSSSGEPDSDSSAAGTSSSGSDQEPIQVSPTPGTFRRRPPPPPFVTGSDGGSGTGNPTGTGTGDGTGTDGGTGTGNSQPGAPPAQQSPPPRSAYQSGPPPTGGRPGDGGQHQGPPPRGGPGPNGSGNPELGDAGA